MARGGARVGAGRKPKTLAAKALHGTALLREKRAKPSQVVEFDAPADLTAAELVVWNELAPHAFKARTLTAGTVGAFCDLCRWRVVLMECFQNPDRRGGADHRGAGQRVQSLMKDFAVNPMGKPLMDEAPKVEDPFASFDEPTVN